MYALPIDGYGPSHWEDLLFLQIRHQAGKLQEQRARAAHARRCRSAKRALIEKQLSLDLLPESRNATLPHASEAGTTVMTDLQEHASGVFSAPNTLLELDVVAARQGCFSAPLSTPSFSCAQVVAPHITATGCSQPKNEWWES